jgi:hypothetical protein
MRIVTGAGLVLLVVGLTHSCAKASQDVLSAGSTCDTVGMTYTANVVPILQENCYSCHGNGNTAGSGGILLEGYTNLKQYADNGQLVGNVTHAPGYVPMPYGLPALPSCETNTIVDWVNNGAFNN